MYEPTDRNVFEVSGRYLEERKDLYYYTQQIIPRHMPEAIVAHILITPYLYANHAGNMEHSRSDYGIIIYANNKPITWYSKVHNKVEA